MIDKIIPPCDKEQAFYRDTSQRIMNIMNENREIQSQKLYSLEDITSIIEALELSVDGHAKDCFTAETEILQRMASQGITIVPSTKLLLSNIKFLREHLAYLWSQIFSDSQNYLNPISNDDVKRDPYHQIPLYPHSAINLLQKINRQFSSFLTDLPKEFFTNKPDDKSYLLDKVLPSVMADQILSYLSPTELNNVELVSRAHQQQLIVSRKNYFHSECKSNAAFGLFQYLWKLPSNDTFANYMLAYYGLDRCEIGSYEWCRIISSNDNEDRGQQLDKDCRNAISSIKKLREKYPEYILAIFSDLGFNFKEVDILKLNSFYKHFLPILQKSIQIERRFDERILRYSAERSGVEFEKLLGLLRNAKFVKRIPNEVLNEILLRIASKKIHFASMLFCDKDYSEYLRKISINQIFNIYLERSLNSSYALEYGNATMKFETILKSMQKETIIWEKLSSSDIILLALSYPEIILNYSKLTEKLTPEQIQRIQDNRIKWSDRRYLFFHNLNSIKERLNLPARLTQYSHNFEIRSFHSRLIDICDIVSIAMTNNEIHDLLNYYNLLYNIRDSIFFSCYEEEYAALSDTLKAFNDFGNIVQDEILKLFTDKLQIEFEAIEKLNPDNFSEAALWEMPNCLPSISDIIRKLKDYNSVKNITEGNADISKLEMLYQTIKHALHINGYDKDRKQLRDILVNNTQQVIQATDISPYKLPGIFKSLQEEKVKFPQSPIQDKDLISLRERIYQTANQQTTKERQQLKTKHYARIALAAICAVIFVTLFWTIPWIKRKQQEQHRSFVYVELPESEWGTMKALRRRLKPDNQTVTTQNNDQTSQLFNRQGEFKKHIVSENDKVKVFMNSEQAVRFDILRAAAKKYAGTITDAQKIKIRSKLNESKQESGLHQREQFANSR
jgi:hypothetical protein